jgi:hypothetical protein
MYSKLDCDYFSSPTACVTRAGAGGGTPSDWKMLRLEKCLKMPPNPQRPVHALLARFRLDNGLLWIGFFLFHYDVPFKPM